jgi:hypothetical protein
MIDGRFVDLIGSSGVSRPARLPVPLGPPVGCRPGHLEHRGGVADRPAVVDDQLRELESMAWSQRGSSARYEDPLVVQWLPSAAPLHVGGPSR